MEVVLSKFDRDLNQLFLKFLRKFLEFLVIICRFYSCYNILKWILTCNHPGKHPHPISFLIVKAVSPDGSKIFTVNGLEDFKNRR